MPPPPFDDALPESFFAALYPEPAAAADTGEPASAQDALAARLVEQWPGAVFVVDRQLRCRLANAAARQWCTADGGGNPGGQPLDALLPAALWDAVLPHLAHAQRGESAQAHLVLPHPRLGPQPVRLLAQPDGTPSAQGQVFLHLQEPSAAPLPDAPAAPPPGGQALHHHDAHLRLMVEGLRDAAIFFLDGQGLVSDWPPSAERLLGHPAQRVLGRHVSHWASPAASDGADDPMLLGMERAALLGQSETPGWQRRADGSTFWAQTQLTALLDERSGELTGYACLMRDMTEVKRLVDMLQELNQALETRVTERTQQLQDINQDLEAFSYSVSHDLRAPLRQIASYVDLLREDLGPSPSADVQQDLGRIASATQHMGQLIEGLLAFARLGRAPLQRRSLAMGDLLQSSINRVQHDPALQRADHEVQWHLPEHLPEVQGDALLLSQVWDNLLANALKYSRPRTPARIGIGWAHDNGEFRFWVQDNGVGFDPRRADRLFGVFQRLHRASEFEGTGIGLALCRRIVERHGGRVWADSTPGSGSTFGFALPASA